MWIYRLFPGFNFGEALINLTTTYYQACISPRASLISAELRLISTCAPPELCLSSADLHLSGRAARHGAPTPSHSQPPPLPSHSQGALLGTAPHPFSWLVIGRSLCLMALEVRSPRSSSDLFLMALKLRQGSITRPRRR